MRWTDEHKAMAATRFSEFSHMCHEDRLAAVMDYAVENLAARVLPDDALKHAWESGHTRLRHVFATLQAKMEDLHGRLMTEEAERIRCRDGWAAASAEVERLQRALVTVQHDVALTDAALRVVAPELIARLTSSCVWCGDEPPDGMQPEALTEYVREHVKTCAAHPMRALEAELARFKPSGQVAEDEAQVEAALSPLTPTFQGVLKERLSRLAAKAQGYEAAVADNAVLLDGFLRMMSVFESLALDAERGGDAARAREHRRSAENLRRVHAQPHPGAALLEQHRKEVELLTGLLDGYHKAGSWSMSARTAPSPRETCGACSPW